MAGITFNTAHQRGHVRAQLDAILAALHEVLDTFVSNRMRRAATEAGSARLPQQPSPQ